MKTRKKIAVKQISETLKLAVWRIKNDYTEGYTTHIFVPYLRDGEVPF